jgi:hypothetical protein
MMSYLRATRHPWANFLLLAPLLVAYEAGVVWLGGTQPDALRNGADAWMRWWLDKFGLGQLYAAPAIVLVVFAFWAWWRWPDRPKDTLGTCFGMVFECGLFAVALWAFNRNFGAVFDHFGVTLASISFKPAPAHQIITYVGAGIYEEVIFRLGLFGGAYLVLRLLLIPKLFAVPLVAVGAALAFAAAHHVNGEPIVAPVFVFRFLAGIFFTVLFVTRGFAVAVGAHAGYDVLVGVAVG